MMGNKAPCPSAISINMGVRRCDTKCITQISMPSATPEATGRCHQVTAHSVSPRWPPGRQSTKQQCKIPPFAGHFHGGYCTARITQWRWFVAVIKATKRRHRVSTCSDITQSDMPTHDFGGIFHRQIDKKGLELTFRPRLTIGV